MTSLLRPFELVLPGTFFLPAWYQMIKADFIFKLVEGGRRKDKGGRKRKNGPRIRRIRRMGFGVGMGGEEGLLGCKGSFTTDKHRQGESLLEKVAWAIYTVWGFGVGREMEGAGVECAG